MLCFFLPFGPTGNMKKRLKKHCSPADESRLRPHSCSRLSVHLSCRGLDPSKWMPGHPCGPSACSYTNLGFLGKLLIQACSGRLTLESSGVVLGSRTLSLMPLEDNLHDGDLLQRDPPTPSPPPTCPPSAATAVRMQMRGGRCKDTRRGRLRLLGIVSCEAQGGTECCKNAFQMLILLCKLKSKYIKPHI